MNDEQKTTVADDSAVPAGVPVVENQGVEAAPLEQSAPVISDEVSENKQDQAPVEEGSVEPEVPAEEPTVEQVSEESVASAQDNAVAEPANDAVLGEGVATDTLESRDEAIAGGRQDAIANHASTSSVDTDQPAE